MMQSTREIYWNVGHGVVVPMYALAALALGICAWGLYRRTRVYRRGRPVHRLDHLPLRLKMLVRDTLAQLQVLRVRLPGVLHSVFFWGFCLLTLGTAVIFLQADIMGPVFDVHFLTGTFYRLFSLVLDIAGLAAVLALGGFLLRRFVFKPKGLETIKDDYLIHAILFVILITGFVIEGVRMAATEIPTNPSLAHFSPVGYLVGRLFDGYTPAQLAPIHTSLWWAHMVLAMGFIALIPFTKLRHIFTGAAQYFLVDLSPKGTIATIDLEDESVDHYGAAKVTDLTWKDLLDADACTRCKRCQDRCPAWTTDKPLSPMQVILQIGEASFVDPEGDLCAKVGTDAIWACTTCRACQEICPTRIEHVNKIIEMRRNLSLMEGAFPGDEVRTAVSNVEVNGNTFGMAFATRGDWASDLDVQVVEQADDVDILYFVGCYASFDRRNQAVARSFVKICRAADVRVGILGKKERCCGEPVRKLGNEYLYQMVARQNVEALNAFGAPRIVTTCPHCFNTLARDYHDLGLTVPVEHHTTFSNRLLAEGRLAVVPADFEFTYHDSCYLGRYMDVFAEPRLILAAAGGRLREMEKSGYESFCCGGGGGRILADEKLGRRISEERVRMARATGAPLLVSNCPFCLTMFDDGIKTGGCEAELRACDLAEIVAERLEARSPIGTASDSAWRSVTGGVAPEHEQSEASMT